MKKRLLSMVLAVVLLVTVLPPVSAGAAEVEVAPAQPPLQTVYDHPATDWESEGTPLGNGFLGAMVFGGVTSDRIQINEHTLWDGGPGADENYDGGMSDATQEQNWQNLQYAREELQKLMNDFTANNSAYIDEDGQLVTHDYPALPSELQSAIDSLKGEKNYFGSYQSFGDIRIEDGGQVFRLSATVNNCRNTDISPLFDGNENTKWFSADGGDWGDEADTQFPLDIVIQYSSGYPIVGYSLINGNDDYGRDPTTWSFWGSDDGQQWTELDRQENVDFTERQEEKFCVFDDTVTYSYYKLTIEANDQYQGSSGWGTQLSEFKLLTGTDPTVNYPVITTNAESGNAAESCSKIFDNNSSTKWYSLANIDGSQAYPVWAQIEYEEALEIASYAIVSGNDMPSRDPMDWELRGSNNGYIWDTLDTQTGVTFPERKQEISFELAEPVSYRFYQLYVTAPNQPETGLQMSDLLFRNAAGEVVGVDDGSEEVSGDYRRVLDVDDAVATVSYTDEEGVYFEREYFVSNPGNFMAIRLTTDTEGALDKYIHFDTPQTAAEISSEGDTITITGRPADHKEELDHLEFAGQIKVVTDGDYEALAGGISVTGASEIILYFTAGTNYQQCMDDSFDYFSDEDPLDGVKERLAALEGKTYEELKQAHLDDYHELYDRVKLDLCGVAQPDKTTDDLLAGYKNGSNTDDENRYLETVYYQFGRYLLIASSREGSLPANLQGIWADGLNPPWDADYHTNINVQMNYWPAEQTNLAECHQPVIDYINSLVPRGEITAELYHCTEDGEAVRGWTTYHENNIWGNTAPATSSAFYFPAGAAWMCQDIWEQYAFNLDEEQLAANFDTLLGAAIFWVDNLVTDERDGTLVSSPSWSPEHGPYSLGAFCDQAIIWELFTDTLAAADVLGRTDPEIEEIRTALSKLSGPQIGLGGQFQEWKDEITMDVTGDYGHRHVNHLFALHPGTMVVAGRSEEDDAYIDAMRVTLETRGDGGTGWSKAWKINFWARMRDGNHAGTMVQQILKESTYNNLFDAHPPFQIDGNFGATAGMTEMLLQSQGDAVELLPALPDMWDNGAVSGLRARGNVEVDVAWEDCQPTAAVLQTFSANDALKVKGLDIGKALVTDSTGAKVDVEVVDDDTILIAAKAGETYHIDFHRQHTLTHTDAKAPTCTEVGNSEYWYCAECGRYFSDEAATVETTLEDTVISATGHKLTATEAKEPTCTEDGNTAYWYCENCEKYFSDEAATKETTLEATVIPALGHDFAKWAYNADQHWKTCSRCGVEDETTREAHNWVEDAERSGEKTVWYVCQCGAEKKGERVTATPAYVLKAVQTDGGKISPSSCAVNAGDTVEFSITPDSGYRIADVLVDGKSVGAVSEYTFKNVSGHHTITAQFTNGTAPVETVKGFTDVTVNDWFADAVEYAVENGLMNGTSATTFSPKGDTTRGMIVTILYRLAGSPEVESDGAAWWSDARVWAMEEGVSDGTNMEGKITREQLAAMLYRYAGSPEVKGDLSAFGDAAKVSDWATDALIWATEEGIVTGKTGGIIDPQAGATRAETATMLMRYCEG